MDSKSYIVKNKKLYFTCNDENFNKQNKKFFHELKGRYYQKTYQWIFPILSQEKLKDFLSSNVESLLLSPDKNTTYVSSEQQKTETILSNSPISINGSLEDISLDNSLQEESIHDSLQEESSNASLQEGSIHDSLQEESIHDSLEDISLGDSFQEESSKSYSVSESTVQKDCEKISSPTFSASSNIPGWNKKFSINPSNIFYEQFKEYFN